MQIELTKEMVMDLVMGTQPSYEVLPTIDHIVDYSDQYGRYTWHTDILDSMTVESLLELYKRCK